MIKFFIRIHNIRPKIWSRVTDVLRIASIPMPSYFVYGLLAAKGRLFLNMDIADDSLNHYWPNIEHSRTVLNSLSFFSYDLKNGLGSPNFMLGHQALDPFNWLLFSLYKSAPEGFLAITILKLILIGALFYGILRSQGIEKSWSWIFSAVYTHSGFIWAYSIHYHFLTAIVFATFLIYAYERSMITSKYRLLWLASFMFSAFSFYFLFQFLVFFLSYAFIRISGEKQNWKALMRAQLRIVGGVLSAGFILVPILNFLEQSPRLVNQGSGILGTLSQMSGWLFDFHYYVTLFGNFLFSNQMFGSGSYFFGWLHYFGPPAVYSGLLPIVCIILLLLNPHQKNWTTWLMVFAIISVILKPFSLIFNALVTPNQFRWAFIIPICFCIFGAHFLQRFRNRKFVVLGTRLRFFSFLLLLLPFVLFFYTVQIYGFNVDQTKIILNKFIQALIVASSFLFILTTLKSRKLTIFFIVSIMQIELVAVGYGNIIFSRTYINKAELEKLYGHKSEFANAIDWIKGSDKSLFRIVMSQRTLIA